MQKNELIAENISKRIGRREILKNVSLSLSGGNVYGFTGENGSGKTMLFRILSGLVRPTEGHVLLNGKDVHKSIGSLNIGLIIENTEMWPDLTGWENLYYLSTIKNKISRDDISGAMIRTGLDPDNDLPIRKYSLGMRQRLVIAQAVMESPDFLFLDEPTNSIDREGTELVRRIISEEAQRGAVVLMASHISEDISSLCSQVYHVQKGNVKKLEGNP